MTSSVLEEWVETSQWVETSINLNVDAREKFTGEMETKTKQQRIQTLKYNDNLLGKFCSWKYFWFLAKGTRQKKVWNIPH